MRGKYFLDTNIFVYSFDSSSKIKQKRAKKLIEDALTNRNGVISYQVIQEFINVATRKFIIPLSMQETNDYLVQILAPLCDSYPSIQLYQTALDISKRMKYSFYDSLIIASAIQSNCNILYTEDLHHGQMISSLTIKNPF